MTMQTLINRPAPYAWVTEQPKRNLRFAEVLEQIAAGRSNRELARLIAENEAVTGKVNPTTIGNMKWGEVPGFAFLERFAVGLRLSPLQRSELFEAAGYLEPLAGAKARLADGLAALAVEFKRPIGMNRAWLALLEQNPGEVDRILADVREALESGREPVD